jgi:hypothetical protein
MRGCKFTPDGPAALLASLDKGLLADLVWTEAKSIVGGDDAAVARRVAGLVALASVARGEELSADQVREVRAMAGTLEEQADGDQS